MSRLPLRALGIPWYDREDYRRILEIMTDAQVLPASYEKWRYAADRLERGQQAAGVVVIRAKIDPDQFPAWCRARGLNVDAKGRTAFANDAAMRAAGTTH